MRITLQVTAGPHKGRTFTFAGHDLFIVGRSPRAHFRLPATDRYFSRFHFLVEVKPPHCRLLDLGSRNGTYVNDRKIATTDLQDGDKITAGRTILRLRVEPGTPVPDKQPLPRAVALPEWVEPGPAAPAVTAAKAAPSADHPPDVSPPPADDLYATLSPPQRENGSVPLSLPPLARAPEVATCRCCDAPAAAEEPGAVEGARSWPLCPNCLDQIHGQPQPFRPYYLVRPLGKGGMGVVYLALRKADGDLVALKTIIPEVAGTRTDVERFLREARILQELRHPHIVAFHEMGEQQGELYFAMEYVAGQDASDLLKAEGPMPVARALGLVGQLLDALEYAHAKGFVHRDIKPANLLVTPAGGRELAKLADFGLGRMYQTSGLSGLTVMGEMGGTLAFMAPEQITNFRDAKPPADQWAAAATLYYLLTGHLVYNLPPALNQQWLIALHHQPVPILERRPDLPRRLAKIIHQALAEEPKDRFADVRALRQALLGLLR